MDKKQALAICGNLSEPVKMPGFSYNLPAMTTCPRAKRLIDKYGDRSVCASCYARKGRYPFPTVQAGMEKHLHGIHDPLWCDAMVFLLTTTTRGRKNKTPDTRWFRWHDSGDILDIGHLRKIVDVCERTPTIHHWLPTHEIGTVKLYLGLYKRFPDNLTVRISADLIGAPSETVHGLPTSTVNYQAPGRFRCPGAETGTCGACRACWNAKAEIDYPLH